MAGQLALALGPPRATISPALTVTELVRLVRDALDARFGDCWVTGEISNARFANSNHLYFTLKDADASISVVMFSSAKRRLRFKPTDGMKVVVRGRVNIYETRGTLQFYAEEMEPRGVGSLQIAFEQLKKRLGEEGLFRAGPQTRPPLFAANSRNRNCARRRRIARYPARAPRSLLQLARDCEAGAGPR